MVHFTSAFYSSETAGRAETVEWVVGEEFLTEGLVPHGIGDHHIVGP